MKRRRYPPLCGMCRGHHDPYLDCVTAAKDAAAFDEMIDRKIDERFERTHERETER